MGRPEPEKMRLGDGCPTCERAVWGRSGSSTPSKARPNTRSLGGMEQRLFKDSQEHKRTPEILEVHGETFFISVKCSCHFQELAKMWDWQTARKHILDRFGYRQTSFPFPKNLNTSTFRMSIVNFRFLDSALNFLDLLRLTTSTLLNIHDPLELQI